jgi:hypothetical protein
MKIHFCDLCNESVPQSDLDLGRAALVKDRVICQKCNELMRGVPGGSGTSGSQETWVPSGAGGAAATLGGSVASQPGSHSHAPYVRQRSGGGGGSALAILALLAVAGLGFWLYDRAEKEAVLMRQRFEELRSADAESAASLDGLRESFETRSQEDQRAGTEKLTELSAQMTLFAQAQAVQTQEFATRLGGFDQRLTALQQSIAGVQHHGKELATLRQEYNDLSTQLRDLGRTMADFSDEAAAARLAQKAGAQGGPEAAAAQPAWMPLIAALGSTDDGDRWQAVIALGETRDPAVAPYIVPVLGDADIFVRMAAARILGDLGAPESIPALIDALSDPEPSVREAVYSALKAVTKRDLPFDALSENVEERNKRIKGWRDWWEREKPAVGG